MKTTTLAVVLLTVLALGAVVFAFMSQSSHYVTVKEAKASKDNNMHLAGKVIPGSVVSRTTPPSAMFELEDDHGDRIMIYYPKPAPSNLLSADRAVAIGGMKDGTYEAQELLLKCPSKYESNNAPAQSGATQ